MSDASPTAAAARVAGPPVHGAPPEKRPRMAGEFCPSSAAVQSRHTSPVPPVAMPGLPVSLT
jgi:hypothetical protein